MSENKKLKKLRGKKDIVQISNEIKLSPDIYIAFEKGERIPKESVKEMIASYFGVKQKDIW